MIEVLKQALEALEEVQKFMNTSDWFNDRVTSLRQAIAELESQEPVAWRTFDGEGQYEYRAYEENESYADDWNKRNPNHKGWVEPLYTHPPQRTEQEQPLPPVEIGVDVTADGASVVAFYRRPNAVMEMFYSQFHPAPQRTWVELTDEETQAYWDWEDWQTGAGRSTIFEMVRDIEAKLKEKNT